MHTWPARTERLPPAEPPEAGGAASTLWADAWRRLRRNRAAVASLVFLVALGLFVAAAPLLGLPSPIEQDLERINEGPSAAHPLGTDELGRDMLSRLVHGGRVSLLVGLGVQTATATIGMALGIAAGYLGGTVDVAVMRVVDTMYAFPPFLFAVFMAAILPPSVWSIVLVLVLVGWPWEARVTRGIVLSLREREFIAAARAVGAPTGRIMVRHILPNALSPIIVGFSIGIAGTIIAESGLSFLGIGIRPPTPSWGGMIDRGRLFLRVYPHLALYPSIALALTVLAFNFLGDGLRDALDPRLRGHR
ncbi:MAG: ABC transporter permease [Armatimonadota bacterium]|nr:ABC transporter permease [Armatimonadota bacterium]